MEGMVRVQKNPQKNPKNNEPKSSAKGGSQFSVGGRGRHDKITGNMSRVSSRRLKQNLKVQKKEGAPMDSGVGTGFGVGSARRKGEDCHGSPQWNTAEHGGHVI